MRDEEGFRGEVDVARLRGLPPDAATELRRAGWPTVEELWKRLGEADFENGLREVADVLRASPEETLDFLADDAVHRAREGLLPGERWVATRERFPRAFGPTRTVAIGLAIALVILVAWRLLPPPREPVLAAARDLPADWRIRPADLTTVEGRGAGLSFADAVGRVTLRPLSPGEQIAAGDLGPIVPADRAVIALDLAAGSLDVVSGETVALAVATEEASILLRDALVLRGDGRHAVFALPPGELAAGAPLLATAAIHPVRGATIPPADVAPGTVLSDAASTSPSPAPPRP